MTNTEREITIKADEACREHDGSANYRHGFYDGAKWMQDRMIEKAAEWLYVYYPTFEKSKSFEEAWEHFKQVMEEK